MERMMPVMETIDWGPRGTVLEMLKVINRISHIRTYKKQIFACSYECLYDINVKNQTKCSNVAEVY